MSYSFTHIEVTRDTTGLKNSSYESCNSLKTIYLRVAQHLQQKKTKQNPETSIGTTITAIKAAKPFSHANWPRLAFKYASVLVL